MMIIILLLMIMVLISVAFFTFLERKIISGTQIRKGPNKINFMGLLQPISDGMKLFFKETKNIFISNKMLFNLAPMLMLILMFMFWLTFNFLNFDIMNLSLIYIIMISNLNIYSIMISGWASNSNYASLGVYRSISQVVSYEINMSFMLLLIFFFMKNYSINMMNLKNSYSHLLIFGFCMIFCIWMFIILAELNRAPFDFAESESELVSGFNIEYGSLKFAFLFISEYGNMIFMSYISMIMFFYQNMNIMIMIMMFMVLIRCSYPRFRYDLLMYLNWNIFLPLTLIWFMNLYLLVY